MGFERLGRLPSSRVVVSVEKVRQVNHKDRRRAMNEVCNILGLLYGACVLILLYDLYMRCGDSRFVPRLLKVDQKLHRLRLCRDQQDPAKRTETLFGSTYGRRTLGLCRDPGTKEQSPLWKSQ